ncbi:MAG: CoA transferase [Thermodesulfobacteriota bacterium]|nr:CoA transferase [Thermodesulfobacteriota bacterium]
MNGPLEGIRILEWSAFQQGPTAGALLADMGAEVIKIEEPRGDPGRGLMSVYGMELPINFYFLNHNRGKKAMVLDFYKDECRDILYKLAEKSDVFLTNYRYSHAVKMQVDYEALSKQNPKLIYAYSSGYGRKGPDADLPSADFAGQARGGFWMMSLSSDMAPIPLGAGAADEMGGLCTAYGIMLALFARERTGKGQMVDTSLLGSQVELGRLFLQLYLVLGFPAFISPAAAMNSPLWSIYRCKDDKWFCLSVLQPDRYWHDFCRILGIEHLEKDPKYENAKARTENTGEIMKITRKAFLTKTRDEWWQLFREAELPSAPVQDCSDLVNDPQIIANEYITEIEDPAHGKIKVPGIPVKLSETPGRVQGTAPELGQHTEEILIDILGYTWEDIAKLQEKGVF